MTAIYTEAEVAKHNTKKDLWLSIHGKVYDLTSYQEDHPGGVASLVEIAGQDGTATFEDLGHSAHAREVMDRYLIGKLDHDEEEENRPAKIERHLGPVSPSPPVSIFGPTASAVVRETLLLGASIATIVFFTRRANHMARFQIDRLVPRVLATSLCWLTSATLGFCSLEHSFHKLFPPKPTSRRPEHFKAINNVAVLKAQNYAVLDPRHYTDLPVASIEKLSSNSNKLVLDLPRSSDVLGLPVGQHIAISTTIDGQIVKRSYTPTSSNKDKGRLELVIKNYDDGMLTGNYLKNVQVGDKISVSGPRGQMRYRRGLASTIGMIAGGTGITPMFQLIRAICEDPKDHTNVVLIYANQAEEDILLKDELDRFLREHSEQFQIHYLLSRPSPSWQGGQGRCNQQLVSSLFAPGADKDNKALICGPPGMVHDAKEWLVTCGYDKANAVSKMSDQVFVF